MPAHTGYSLHLRSRLPSRAACARPREGSAQEGGFMPSTTDLTCSECGRTRFVSAATAAKVDAAIEAVIAMLEVDLEPGQMLGSDDA